MAYGDHDSANSKYVWASAGDSSVGQTPFLLDVRWWYMLEVHVHFSLRHIDNSIPETVKMNTSS